MIEYHFDRGRLTVGENVSDLQQQLNYCCNGLLIYFISLKEFGTEFCFKNLSSVHSVKCVLWLEAIDKDKEKSKSEDVLLQHHMTRRTNKNKHGSVNAFHSMSYCWHGYTYRWS
jgi:uncharacterized protein YwqG